MCLLESRQNSYYRIGSIYWCFGSFLIRRRCFANSTHFYSMKILLQHQLLNHYYEKWIKISFSTDSRYTKIKTVPTAAVSIYNDNNWFAFIYQVQVCRSIIPEFTYSSLTWPQNESRIKSVFFIHAITIYICTYNCFDRTVRGIESY